MGRRQQWVYHIEPEEFPEDFPERLEAFMDAAALTWRGLARRLKVNTRTVRRWKAGARPGSRHLFLLLTIAESMGLRDGILMCPDRDVPAAVDLEAVLQ